MSRTESKHISQKGFAVCPHTCVTNPCISRTTKTVLWVREGNAARRHASSSHVHFGCTPECPANALTLEMSKEEMAAVRQRLAYLFRPSKAQLRAVAIIQSLGTISKERLSSLLSAHSTEVAATYLDPISTSSRAVPLLDMEIDGIPSMDSDEDILHPTDIDMVAPSPTQPLSLLLRGTSILTVFNSSRPPPVPAQHRAYNILYIPDPSRCIQSVAAALHNLAYTERSIPRSMFEKVNECIPGFLFATSGKRSAEIVKVVIFEWVWVMMALARQGKEYRKNFDVSFMSWDTFKNGIVRLERQVIQTLMQTDCVLGGIDYTIYYKTHPSYNWSSPEEIETFVRNLRTVRPLRMWPLPRQLERAGTKLSILSDLLLIAARIPAAPPNVIQLDLKTDPVPVGTVLKRSHSECSLHIILPHEEEMRTIEHLQSQISGDEFWMSQDYVETLDRLGEFRVFIIGGEIVHIVHTHVFEPEKSKGKKRAKRQRDEDESILVKEWHGKRVQQFWTLNELSERIGDPEFTAMDVSNPDEGTISIRREGRAELEDFALQTWRQLVLMEKADYGGSVSLSVFCRLDIGINMRDGKAMYFVNEVERSLTTSLWMRAMNHEGLGVFADTFSAALHRWLDSVYNPEV